MSNAEQLAAFEDWKIIPGIANFLLCHLPDDGPTAAEIVKRCRARGLFLRDPGAMGRTLGTHALRIAVKDALTNQRMMEILSEVWATADERIETTFPFSPSPREARAGRGLG